MQCKLGLLDIYLGPSVIDLIPGGGGFEGYLRLLEGEGGSKANFWYFYYGDILLF